MAQKKLKLRPKKKTIRKLKRDSRFIAAILVGLFISGVLVGVGISGLLVAIRPYDQHPSTLVVAADKSVQIPSSLLSYLQEQDDCNGYTGASIPGGVSLWVVYQISQNKFAKISYGCSTHLNSYIMAIKVGNKWQLLKPSEYFGGTGFLPKCQQVEKYKINSSVEPFCIAEDASARPNAVK